MKLQPEHTEHLRQESEKIRQVDQLAELLQWIYEQLYPESKGDLKIESRHLAYYAFKCKDRYKKFEIPKKSGDARTISAPRYKLKVIQRCLNELLQVRFTPHKYATGFVPEKSVADNALPHVGKRYVYNIDLRDFFPSVQFRRVKVMLQREPISFSDEIAFLIANLCCEKGCLPQGAPTSPTLTNLICQRLDRKLLRLAKKYKARYSRYADDITFSSNRPAFNKGFRTEMLKVIGEENFQINPAKERHQSSERRQEVTGVVVNEKLNVNRQYIKDVRYWLRTWEKFGAKETQADFERRYEHKKGVARYGGKVPSFTNYLYGKILYLGMIRGETDPMFQRFLASYKSLRANLSDDVPDLNLQTDSLNKIFEIWRNDGIKAAMEEFFRDTRPRTEKS